MNGKRPVSRFENHNNKRARNVRSDARRAI